MNLDTLLYFFLGPVPDDQYAYLIYYTARILIGILFFNAIFDLFRFAKSFVTFGKR